MQLSLFIRRPILSTAISLVIVLCGLVAMFNLPVSQFPSISPPSISVSASFPGANAETGAKVVASQLEKQLNGVSNIMYMTTSTTAVGTISITLTYNVGTNLNFAINEVLNRLQAAMPLLPSVVQRMGVTARKSSPDMLLTLSFYSDPYINPVWVSNYLTRTVENDLLMLPSVGTVNVFGTGSFAVMAWLDPNKMQRYKISVSEIENAINDQNEEYVVGRANGVPHSESNALTINMRGSQMFASSEELGNVIIRNNNNQPIRIKDIARVELGSNNYNTIAQINFRDESGNFKRYPCSIMQIYLQPSANQLEAKAQIMKVLEEDSKRFPNGLRYRVNVDNSRFVKASVENVVETLEIAFILVALVIYLFLQDWRASLIAIISIPVSIIGTMACLYMFGFSLNTLSLFALILAIGIVVDDSIVIVENIERIRSEYPDKSLFFIVELTIKEVFSAIVAIMLVLSVVFIPVMVMGGLAGIMYRQFAVTIACAVILSGISALTFTPAISSLILKGHITKPSFLAWFDKFFDWLTAKYVGIATFLVRNIKITLVIWTCVIVAMVALFSMVSRGFVPGEDQGLIFATANLPSSTGLQETKEKINTISEDLTKNPNVQNVVTVTGLDFIDFGSVKTYAATFFIVLKDWDKRTKVDGSADKVIEQINKLGNKDPNLKVLAFNQPPIRGLSTTSGVDFFLEDRVKGDPRALKLTADALLKRLNTHKEVKRAIQTLDTNVYQISIVPNVERALYYGVNLNDLYSAIQTVYSNNNVNYAYIMQDLVWVILEMDYPSRKNIQNLSNIYLKSSNTNEMVPVNSVVNVTDGKDAQVIQRFNDYFATKITVFPADGYSAGDVMNVIDEEITSIPKEYNYEWFGTSYMQKKSQSTSANAFVFSLVMIYLVLAALYEMWRLPWVVLMGIPCALFGSAVILFLSGKENDLYFQISLIALLGLSAKNIILLVEFALQRYDAGHDLVESALHALKVRFRPIVMTSVTFIAGTVPLVLAGGAGANAQHSVGMGIIGGILGSVFLGTLFTPAFFVMIMKRKNK